MVTRNLKCPECDHKEERTALGMSEPSHVCPECDMIMDVMPAFNGGFKFSAGCHSVDYPKSNAHKIKDYGLEEHDSTNPNADYHQDGYAEEMASNVPGARKPTD